MKLAMDDGIGAIAKKLKQYGLFDNTLIIFLSDNGSPRGQGLTPDKDMNKDRGGTTMSSPGPCRDFKGDVYEGGIRVPFLMHWPQKLKTPQVYSKPIISLDVAPTIMAAVQASKQQGLPFDGANLWPSLSNPNIQAHDTLYWRRGNDYAILQQGWKLQWNDAGNSKKVQLFHLKEDPEERKDLSFSLPEKAQALQDAFDAWDSQLPPQPNGQVF